MAEGRSRLNGERRPAGGARKRINSSPARHRSRRPVPEPDIRREIALLVDSIASAHHLIRCLAQIAAALEPLGVDLMQGVHSGELGYDLEQRILEPLRELRRELDR